MTLDQKVFISGKLDKKSGSFFGNAHKPRELKKEDLESVLHLSQRDAAKKLNISVSSLQRKFKLYFPNDTWKRHIKEGEDPTYGDEGNGEHLSKNEEERSGDDLNGGTSYMRDPRHLENTHVTHTTSTNPPHNAPNGFDMHEGHKLHYTYRPLENYDLQHPNGSSVNLERPLYTKTSGDVLNNHFSQNNAQFNTRSLHHMQHDIKNPMYFQDQRRDRFQEYAQHLLNHECTEAHHLQSVQSLLSSQNGNSGLLTQGGTHPNSIPSIASGSQLSDTYPSKNVPQYSEIQLPSQFDRTSQSTVFGSNNTSSMPHSYQNIFDSRSPNIESKSSNGGSYHSTDTTTPPSATSLASFLESTHSNQSTTHSTSRSQNSLDNEPISSPEYSMSLSSNLSSPENQPNYGPTMPQTDFMKSLHDKFNGSQPSNLSVLSSSSTNPISYQNQYNNPNVNLKNGGYPSQHQNDMEYYTSVNVSQSNIRNGPQFSFHQLSQNNQSTSLQPNYQTAPFIHQKSDPFLRGTKPVLSQNLAQTSFPVVQEISSKINVENSMPHNHGRINDLAARPQQINGGNEFQSEPNQNMIETCDDSPEDDNQMEDIEQQVGSVDEFEKNEKKYGFHRKECWKYVSGEPLRDETDIRSVIESVYERQESE